MKKLFSFLFPGITGPIFGVPAGVTADAVAGNGLFGLMQNVNTALGLTPTAITTAGTNTTLTAAQVDTGFIQLNAGASGGFTITLPSTSAILTQFGNTIPTDGTFSMILYVQNNNVGQTGTLTAGDVSTTISGTATIATNTTRIFAVTVAAGGATLTITNLGSLTL